MTWSLATISYGFHQGAYSTNNCQGSPNNNIWCLEVLARDSRMESSAELARCMVEREDWKMYCQIRLRTNLCPTVLCVAKLLEKIICSLETVASTLYCDVQRLFSSQLISQSENRTKCCLSYSKRVKYSIQKKFLTVLER